MIPDHETVLIPFSRIGRHIGLPENVVTFHRWRVTGVLHNGERVKLPAVRIGGRFFVTEVDLHAFIERLNDGSYDNPLSGDRLSSDEIDERLDELRI